MSLLYGFTGGEGNYKNHATNTFFLTAIKLSQWYKVLKVCLTAQCKIFPHNCDIIQSPLTTTKWLPSERELSLLNVQKYLPIVVITVAAKITAFGQFQLLKVLLPVMVTPWPAASDTT